MCYTCMLNNPFAASDDSTSPKRKRQRLLEIKQIFLTMEGNAPCAYGAEALAALKDEQYRLSRELLHGKVAEWTKAAAWKAVGVG